MNIAMAPPMPKLAHLPPALPLDNAIRVELEEGVPIFRASTQVQKQIELLLDRQQSSTLSATDEEELKQYEEMDDYLSFVNRVIRNLIQTDPHQPDG